MEWQRITWDEWRELSDEEQSAAIRAGYRRIEDLPSPFRQMVEEMAGISDAAEPT